LTLIRLRPDKVEIQIHVDRLEVGCSFFVPCINVKQAQRQMYEQSAALGIKFKSKSGVYNGLYGVCFSRVS